MKEENCTLGERNKTDIKGIKDWQERQNGSIQNIEGDIKDIKSDISAIKERISSMEGQNKGFAAQKQYYNDTTKIGQNWISVLIASMAVLLTIANIFFI